MIRRLAISLTAAAAIGAGAAATPASAADVSSTNWGGYAVTGTSFRHVSSRWTEPKGDCEPSGQRSIASAWVGLGGFVDGSPGLEQTGADMICGPAGRTHHEAWYELIPAPSRSIKMKIHGGDKMAAGVTVRGKRVTITLTNRTTHKRFVKRTKMKHPGIESAEWIVEAPSGCTLDGSCDVLPLANFIRTPFSRASATSLHGHTGSISSSAWDRTSIELDTDEGPMAIPGPLTAHGAAFGVRYEDDTSSEPGAFGKRTFPSSGLPRRFPSHLAP